MPSVKRVKCKVFRRFGLRMQKWDVMFSSMGVTSINSCGVNLKRKTKCGQELNRKQVIPKNRRKSKESCFPKASVILGCLCRKVGVRLGKGKLWCSI